MSLLDWRRRIADLYGAIRQAPAREGWSRWRETRDRLFGEHAQSPLPASERAGFAGIPCFAYDPELRFEIGVIRLEDDAPLLEAEGGPDGTIGLSPFAITSGLADALGRELTLYWIKGYGGGVFLPFADATSGGETYGGGRYLLDTIKGADLGATSEGSLILDFNFAYHPSCAYSSDWICPLSPRENRLPAAIGAGERSA